MNQNVQLPDKTVLKGSLILLSYFLLAACMQHDESLSPDRSTSNSSELNASEAAADPAMIKRTFTAHLKSDNEVNATQVVESQGQGQAILTFSKDGTELHYKLIVSNIEDVIQAHIHCGQVGVNGPFVVFLFPLTPAGVTVNGILAEGTITQAEVLNRPACSGGFATFADLADRIRSGAAYVNVHTIKYPGGEIRGQVK